MSFAYTTETDAYRASDLTDEKFNDLRTAILHFREAVSCRSDRVSAAELSKSVQDRGDEEDWFIRFAIQHDPDTVSSGSNRISAVDFSRWAQDHGGEQDWLVYALRRTDYIHMDPRVIAFTGPNHYATLFERESEPLC